MSMFSSLFLRIDLKRERNAFARSFLLFFSCLVDSFAREYIVFHQYPTKQKWQDCRATDVMVLILTRFFLELQYSRRKKRKLMLTDGKHLFESLMKLIQSLFISTIRARKKFRRNWMRMIKWKEKMKTKKNELPEKFSRKSLGICLVTNHN